MKLETCQPVQIHRKDIAKTVGISSTHVGTLVKTLREEGMVICSSGTGQHWLENRDPEYTKWARERGCLYE